MYIVLWSMQPYNTGPKQPYAKKYKHQKFVFLWNVMLIFAGFIKININCFLQMFLMWWMAQDEYCVLIFFKQRPMSRAPKKPKIQHDTKISSIIKVDEYWHSHIFVCFAWKKKILLGALAQWPDQTGFLLFFSVHVLYFFGQTPRRSALPRRSVILLCSIGLGWRTLPDEPVPRRSPLWERDKNPKPALALLLCPEMPGTDWAINSQSINTFPANVYKNGKLRKSISRKKMMRLQYSLFIYTINICKLRRYLGWYQNTTVLPKVWNNLRDLPVL